MSAPSPQGIAIFAAGLASLGAFIWYLIQDDEEETVGSNKGKSSSGTRTDKPTTTKSSSSIQLDMDDLDEEERKALAEVSKKGYYHGRPKSEAASTPHQRISQAQAAQEGVSRRAEFDEFQKKWDKFDNKEFVKAQAEMEFTYDFEGLLVGNCQKTL
eukprot:CAMPEP_0194770352 /NCGR_PEP_ID=MMETSP0323_2-20130528/45980_1 /TAXON_ID=2866 ORGANISM="Crypthecodinium cohnii, Strain Seligo" /NCGR_SAMPLE_ID=MMETSP0323_2 /ASSEMBLY_ACC=CAM_ASM_000346 /LENGTH=156 /DNA_ID=CAMNT_0039703877 /DNA_START=14 /DNA_END=481 /DNA_ORIENTATION=-